jgi:hypothetical protein
MEESTRERLIRGDIWVRALFMVLFAIAFGLTRVIIVFVVIFQFLAVLITGRANEPLLQFGKNLSVYILEILEFQTFNTELRPFPFSPWPDEEPGGEEWIDGAFFDDAVEDENVEEQEVTPVAEVVAKKKVEEVVEETVEKRADPEAETEDSADAKEADDKKDSAAKVKTAAKKSSAAVKKK